MLRINLSEPRIWRALQGSPFDATAATTSAPQAGPAVRSDARPAATETPPARAATLASTALAATGANPAAIAAELAGPPDPAGKDQSSPSFDMVIAGSAAPGATVDLLRGR
jgi:hypothetical protein